MAEPPGACKCSTKFNINVDEHLLSIQLNKPQVFSHTLACTNTTKHHQQHRHLHVGTGVSSHLPHFKTSEQQVKQYASMQKLQLDLLSNKQQLCWNRLKPTYVTTLVGVFLFVTFPSQTIYNDENLQTKHIKKIHVHLFCYYNFLLIIIFSWWYFTPKAYLEWCDIILKACIENFAEIDSNKTITWRFFFTIELIFTW